MQDVIIFGAGIAGYSAALECARQGKHVLLIAVARTTSNSVMAEGGINAALNEKDSTDSHFADTVKSAQGIASKRAIRNLVDAAPNVVKALYAMGTQFSTANASGGSGTHLAQRSFGGQSFNRTCFAYEETGKQITTALRDEVRRYEREGLIKFEEGRFSGLLIEDGRLVGALAMMTSGIETATHYADAVIMATGGLHGLFSIPTGAFHNTADAAGILLTQGVEFSNLEFIQYHPTTAVVGCRRILISESARGEGGRLCILRDGQPYYFLEEQHPELGRKANLLSRDVVALACAEAGKEGQVYLDLREIPEKAYEGRLRDTADDCRIFLKIDPQKDLIPVEPGVHYFMGGIKVDENHRTNLERVYAAGECCAQYHGANRLGGNSLLGAAYGGRIAALSALEDLASVKHEQEVREDFSEFGAPKPGAALGGPFVGPLCAAMDSSLGVVRDGATMEKSLAMLQGNPMFASAPRVQIGCAALMSALARKESRGAHFRSDYPETLPEFEKASVARMVDGEISITFEEVD